MPTVPKFAGVFSLWTLIYLSGVSTLAYSATVECDELSFLLEANPALETVISRKAVQAFIGAPEMRSVVDNIENGRSFQISKPFEFTGRVTQENGVLTVVVTGIDANAPRKPLSIWETFAAAGGYTNVYFQSAPSLQRNAGRAIAAVAEAVAKRAAKDSSIKQIKIRVDGVMNIAMKSCLESKFGFRVVHSSSMGGGGLYDVELSVTVPERNTNPIP